MHELFDRLPNDYEVNMVFFEIYMEKIQDLLNTSQNNKNTKDIKITEDIQGIHLKNITYSRIENYLQAIKLYKKGVSNRTSGETKKNKKSSRSHAIFTLIIKGPSTVSKMHLVDLAGSEKQK